MAEEKENLTTRKKLAVWVLLLIVKIIEPTNYSHDYSKELEEVKTLLKEI